MCITQQRKVNKTQDAKNLNENVKGLKQNQRCLHFSYFIIFSNCML